MDLNGAHWHPEARADAFEARSRYSKQSLTAAQGFLLALGKAVNVVLEAPARWRVDPFGFRHYLVPSQYPYTLVSRTRDDIEIVAIAHQKQRLRFWNHR